jgi:hypothetical protein
MLDFICQTTIDLLEAIGLFFAIIFLLSFTCWLIGNAINAFKKHDQL